MRKIAVLLTTSVLIGTAATFAVAAPSKDTLVTNTQIVQATRDTTVSYQGVKIFVPAGQTVILGKRADGSILIRGINLNGVKIGDGFISSLDPVILVVEPATQVISVLKGNDVIVKDATGRTAVLSVGTSASLSNTHTSAKVAENTQEVADVLPPFVAETEMSSAASEQATQDVTETEETLSPSAPR